jgi:predicted DNA-binding transcriptional regulator AlpA
MDSQLEHARLLRLPEVMRLTGLSRSTIYQLASTLDFPKPVKLGRRISAWLAREVTEWIDHRATQTRHRRLVSERRS